MSASIYSIQALFALALTFVLFDKSAAGRQNRWECEEQSSEAGTNTFCDQVSAGGDNSSEGESDHIFVPLGPFQSRRTQSDNHWLTQYK
jgi:hypothetical protein